MKRSSIVTLSLALLPFVSACFDLDLDFGAGLVGFSGQPTLAARGSITVGPYPSLSGEAHVLVYAPSDTTRPVTTVATVTSVGTYTVDFGVEPSQQVCSYLARARLWNGDESDIRPLFSSPPSPCVSEAGVNLGPDFEFPDYEPLAEPFMVRGQILIDGAPAGENTAMVTLLLRDGPMSSAQLRTDADGWFNFHTSDQAIWFGLCSSVEAAIRGDGRPDHTSLSETPLDRCVEGRTLPVVRIGSTKAAIVRIGRGDATGYEPIAAGGATVVLVDPNTHAPLGDTATTLDDGTAHVWFSDDLGDQPCDAVLQVTLTDGRGLNRPLLFEGTPCTPPHHHGIDLSEFRAPGEGPPLTLTVEDPVGDHTGRSDVTRMFMDVDPQTGAYEIRLVADSANPFVDSLRVNVNLYNVTASSFFAHTVDDRFIAEPTDTLTLSGQSDVLLWWGSGDEVFTNSLEGTPNPPGSSLFRSSVTHFPMGFLTNEDVIGFEDLSQPAIVVVR